MKPIKRILIVDNEELIVQFLERYLMENGDLK